MSFRSNAPGSMTITNMPIFTCASKLLGKCMYTVRANRPDSVLFKSTYKFVLGSLLFDCMKMFMI